MEISALFSPIWRQKWFILLFSVIGGILLLLYSQFLSSPNYYAHVFFTVAYRDEQNTPEDYAYANYYGNYASIEFARTVSAWPKDPYFITEIYDNAGVDKDSDQGLMDKLLGNFSVTAQERANLRVNIRSKSEENLRKLSASFVTILRGRLDNYNRQSATQYQLVNVSTTPFITFLQSDEALPIGLILGLLLGLAWAYIWETWQGKLSTAQQVEETFGQPLFWERKGANNPISPVSTLINSWDKDVVMVSNRIAVKKFLKALDKATISPLHIITSTPEQFKKHLNKDSVISVAKTPSTSKKITKVLHWIHFPIESNFLLDLPKAPIIVIAQRGNSRIHELQSLDQLTEIKERAIILL